MGIEVSFDLISALLPLLEMFDQHFPNFLQSGMVGIQLKEMKNRELPFILIEISVVIMLEWNKARVERMRRFRQLNLDVFGWLLIDELDQIS